MKKLGGSIASFVAITGSASAGSRRDKRSAKDAGIQEKFNSLMDNCRFDSAAGLMEKHGVNFTREKQLVSSAVSGSSGDITTQDYYDKRNSTISFYSGDWSTGQKVLGMSWDLSGVSVWDPDGPAPSDKCTLAFEEDIFGYVGGSVRHTGKVTTDNGVYTDLTTLESVPPNGEKSNGVVVSFNDNWVINSTAHGEGYMQIVVRKQDENDMGRLGGKYAHLWSISNGAAYGLDNIDISAGGIISYINPFDAGLWTIGDSSDA